MRFLFVDEILAMVPGESIRAVKEIDPNEDYFQDHFPGFPVVPGVLLTEMMAQAAGKCLAAEDPRRGKAMLAKINKAAFRDWVRPGQKATIFASIRSSRPQYATAHCHIEVGSKRVCEAELFFHFVTVDTFAAGYQDHVLERFLSRCPPGIGNPDNG